MQKLRSIQVLRAMAVLAVVICHAANWLPGQAGVDLFFVISGLIIGMVMQGRSASDFLFARVWRIYPIYWFNAVPLVIAAVIGGTITPTRLATSVTLWPIWGTYAAGYVTPAWTLSFEMLFYSLVAVGLAVKRPLLVVPTLLGAIVLNAVTGAAVLGFVGNPIVLEFCAGLFILNLPRHLMIGAGAFVIACVVVCLAPEIHINTNNLMHLSVNATRLFWFGIPACGVVYGALCFEESFGTWANGLVFVGDASYSIYLLHFFLNIILPFWWPLKVVACLLAGSAMYWWIERQFIAMRPRWPKHPAAARGNYPEKGASRSRLRIFAAASADR